eukprot:760790-Prorocentrum_lima.AAC.1
MEPHASVPAARTFPAPLTVHRRASAVVPSSRYRCRKGTPLLPTAGRPLRTTRAQIVAERLGCFVSDSEMAAASVGARVITNFRFRPAGSIPPLGRSRA